MVNEYRDVFVGKDVVGRSNYYIRHHVRTNLGTQPITSKLYEVNYENREVVGERILEMLGKDVIQASASP